MKGSSWLRRRKTSNSWTASDIRDQLEAPRTCCRGAWGALIERDQRVSCGIHHGVVVASGVTDDLRRHGGGRW
jgi:hypothetical protein